MNISLFKNVLHIGWFFSILWPTSIIWILLLWINRLYGDKSAWTRLQYWYNSNIIDIIWYYRYIGLSLLSTNLIHGFNVLISYNNSITIIQSFNKSGSGHNLILYCVLSEYILLRFLNSFSLHNFINFLWLWDPLNAFLNRYSPFIYADLSLNTRILVLNILMAKWLYECVTFSIYSLSFLSIYTSPC